ncbi:GCN5-related protein N-acetyltransferase [Beutenbergia cavernae DSM 12333]|uniref:GCN5-related protein N-acetyltransferase n=1 Tax=Beutenbergia cavernae (strain ATCC BAA-8 / DSM 12333 / CCUG 43141 / JCM 11478 / NBRC 16432 / NCIMB 13614 / HKI 0122) TaxID=471853 RepID=C5BVU3_BEUC1|nr:GNAT family N-acetyltransferase [Beutenbergia cavernae]ACQ78533.1 GCN5-related protein N-acetyltransferase [Beutenbergia cavernae DSM 12333]
MTNVVVDRLDEPLAAGLAAVHARDAVVDGIDPRSVAEQVPTADDLQRTARDAEEFRLATGDGGEPVGWGARTSWVEDDGTRVVLLTGHVAAGYRGRGVGARLLRDLEASARDARPGPTPRRTSVLGANASSHQDDRRALLESAGFAVATSMAEMRLDSGDAPPPRAAPADVAVRDAVPGDAAALHTIARRAWAGREFFAMPPLASYADWLGRADLTLFRVAEADGVPIGYVAAEPRGGGVTELDDVAVDPAFQRRGIASALCRDVAGRAVARGARELRLVTEADDPAGARSLYAGLGFDVVREHLRYRKPLA